MENKLTDLRKELLRVRNDAVAAHIAGDRHRADCLTGKAVGMKSTLDIAERAATHRDAEAAGEIEGMERVINTLSSELPRC